MKEYLGEIAQRLGIEEQALSIQEEKAEYGFGQGVRRLLTERVTRQEIMRLIPDKTAGSVVRALNTIERKYGKLFPAVFKSITVDNGSEFADCAGLEQSVLKKRAKRTKMYYCHPYCSSERGSNEKQNQMIRRKFPKGTNFDKVSPKEVKMVEDWLNRYPRKILGWYSSADMFRALIEAV